MIAKYRDGRDSDRAGGGRGRAARGTECRRGDQARPLRPDRRARGSVGLRPRPERLRDRAEAVGAGQGRSERGQARRGALHAGRRAPGRSPWRSAPFLPETAPRILAALGQSDDLAWSNVAYGRTVATEGRRAGRAALPSHRSFPTPLDRHARASRRVADAPAAELLAPRPGGRRRARVAVGCGLDVVARDARDRRAGGRRLRGARVPSAPGGRARPTSTRCASCSPIRRPSPWARRASTTTATTRRATRRSRSSARRPRWPSRSWRGRL